MSRRQTILTACCVLGFLLILSSVALSFGINWWISGRNSQSWQQTNGQLVRISFLGANARGGASRLSVEYKYDVEGINYEGNRISFGLNPSDGEFRNLQAGDNVKIYFDQKNPAESVLISGVTFGTRAFTFFGAFCVAIIFAAAVSMWFSFRSDEI
jgi:hypothetical protein